MATGPGATPTRPAEGIAGPLDGALSAPKATTREPWVRQAFGPPEQALRAVLIVLVTAAVWGGLTSFGQQYLPDEVRSLANASGPWFAVVMGSIVVARPRLALAIILGILGLIVMNESYGVVSRSRGFPYGGGLTSIWNQIALLVGPVAGIAATWLRSPRPVLAALGVAAPAAVFIGEGLYGLTAISDTTSPVFWSIELATGVSLIAVAAIVRIRAFAAIGVLVGASALGAALFYAVYSSL